MSEESFDQREMRILQFWESNKIFQKSIEQRKGSPTYTFYDGPPFATGLPHYGHLLAGTIKDVVPRYKTMKGYYIPRRNGWDCHGLPVENEIEKSKGLSGAHSIEEFGIDKFNEACREIVLRYTGEWKETVLRMGRWVDFDQTWRTMDLDFMESVWWVFEQLWKKGLVYKGFKVMPFSAKLGTPLSNFEAGENYQEIDDPSLVVYFPLDEEPNVSLLAWTTTPWTLISNLALMVQPDDEYVLIEHQESGKKLILAKARLASHFPESEKYTVLKSFHGKELEGKTYQPPFDYFIGQKEKGAFRVLLENSVSMDEGTGIVHSSPAFGEVDFYACKNAGIEMVCPVDNNGRFTQEIPEYTGKFVKDCDKDIIKTLKGKEKVFFHGTCRHRYPFCWRSDTPLIYKAVSTWFVNVESIKDGLLKANTQIHWTPGHLKEGRFGKWLENARDWAISRNRFWGTPIPIWQTENGKTHVVGSIQELEELTGAKITDLHRHFIDDLAFTIDGKEYRRIPEVFDCWFESGSMPYGQNHYPFESRELFERNFPADFIAEGLDQTRTWFYVLTVLSVALFDQPAFKNVIANGILLASDGNKMSKRLKNYPEPTDVVHRYGADAVRLYMLNSPAARADDLCFSERGVELTLRQVLIPLWNAYSFFNTYAQIENWNPPETLNPPEVTIDRWILSLLNKLIQDVEEGMDAYDLILAVKPFVGFVDQLTNWYIRRSRRRFWESGDDQNNAFQTLYQVLMELSKIAAPFIPFMSEALYQNLKTASMPESVHLCDFPTPRPERRELNLEKTMTAVQVAVSLGHALRKEHKLKVRQPLPAAYLICENQETLYFLENQKHLVAEELNVKEIFLESDESKFVHWQAKPNFRTLGQKLGKQMKEAQKQISQLDQNALHTLRSGQNITIELTGQRIELTPEDIEVNRIVKEGLIAQNEGEITVALDSAISDELLLEGLAREVVNKVNTQRREEGFDVSDRVHLSIETTDRLKECFEKYGDYIEKEVLALSVTFAPNEGREWTLNEVTAKIHIEKGS